MYRHSLKLRRLQLRRVAATGMAVAALLAVAFVGEVAAQKKKDGKAAEGRDAASPNFIVILTDDQSWVGSSLEVIPDDPRTRGDYFLTPHIERLAAMGMVFTQGCLLQPVDVRPDEATHARA